METKGITIEIVQEVALDKNGKEVKDPKGEKQYKRDDFVGLINLLNRFDSKRHTMEEFKQFINTKDVILDAWQKENKKLQLSLSQAAFLRTYLADLSKKEGLDRSLQEFEIRTLVGVLSTLE